MGRWWDRRRREPSDATPAPRGEIPEWATKEADLRRQIKTLEVAYGLRTISRERYEEQLRRLERRLAELES